MSLTWRDLGELTSGHRWMRSHVGLHGLSIGECGLLETWDAQMTPAEFEEKVEKQFAEFKKNFLNDIHKEKVNND